MKPIEERQEELLLELYDPKYSCSHSYKERGSYTKPLVTSLGTIRFKVKRLIRGTDNRTSSPILDALDVNTPVHSTNASRMLMSTGVVVQGEVEGIVDRNEVYVTAGSKRKLGFRRSPRTRGLKIRGRGTNKTDNPVIRGQRSSYPQPT